MHLQEAVVLYISIFTNATKKYHVLQISPFSIYKQLVKKLSSNISSQLQHSKSKRKKYCKCHTFVTICLVPCRNIYKDNFTGTRVYLTLSCRVTPTFLLGACFHCTQTHLRSFSITH